MSDRSIIIKLDADIGSLRTNFKHAEKAVRDYGSQAKKFAQENREDLEQVGQAGLVMGAGLVAGFGLAVKTFADFDASMSDIRAATHETEENMESLREAAVNAGADTAYSAVEAASAIEEMAKAGVSTADILSGGLDSALSLAAAGSLEVGTAAEIAATALTQFSLSGEDLPHVADLLAAGAGKAQGSVEDMGAALKQAGLVADMTGLSIEETTAGLAAFASAGLIGSDAGTSFKSMLQRLTPQSKEAQKAMDTLGISAYDAQGEFIGLEEFAGNLQGALADLTPEQRNAALATMFGSDAVRAANVLYEQGAKGIEDWTEKVNDAGYASESAAIRMDNLKGDLEKLSGSIESVFLTAGSGANDVLRDLVQSLEDVVDWIGTLDPKLLSAAGMIAGVTGAALLAGGAFFTMAPRIFDTVDGFKRLNAAGGKTSKMLGRVQGAALPAATALLGLHIASELAGTGLDDIGSSSEFESAIRQLATDANDGAAALDNLATVSGSSLTSINGLGDALETVNLSGFLKGMDFVGSMFGVFDTEVGLAEGALESYSGALTKLVESGHLDMAAEGFAHAVQQGKLHGTTMEETAESFSPYIDALRDSTLELGVVLSEKELLDLAMGETNPQLKAAEAAREFGAAMNSAGLEVDGTVESMGTLIDQLFQTGMLTQSVVEAEDAFTTSVRTAKQAVDENIAALQEKYIADGMGEQAAYNQALAETVNTKALEGNSEAAIENRGRLIDMVDASRGVVQAQAEQGASEDDLAASMGNTYDRMIDAAFAMSGNREQAESLTRELLGIPDNVDVETWMSTAAQTVAQNTKAAVDNIPSHKRITLEMVQIDMGGGKTYTDNWAVDVPRKASGGLIVGPGTGTSDTAGLYALSNREYVVSNKSVEKYGVGFMDDLNAGNLRPASLPAAASSASAPQDIHVTAIVENPWTGEQVDARVRSVAVNATGNALGSAQRRVDMGGKYVGNPWA